MEAFSSLIQQLQLSVEVYHNAQVCGDWRIQEHKLGSTCFHMVTLGACQLSVPGHLETELNCGDLVIFPRELPHSMHAMGGDGRQQHLSYRDAAGLEGTGMLCGSAQFRHRGSQFLLDALPAVFVIPQQHSSDWSQSLLDMIMAESVNPQAGSSGIVDRLSELLFIHALRYYLSNHPDQAGVLALYSHPFLAKAVTQIHQDPSANWSLEQLASHAAMSRTRFAESFKQVSGWTAMQYLAWWRMQLAWGILAAGSSVGQAAYLVGYQSEAAFSRAFQKQFQQSPGKVRRSLQRQDKSG